MGATSTIGMTPIFTLVLPDADVDPSSPDYLNFTTDRQLITSAIERAADMKLDEPAFFNEGVFHAAAQSRKATIPSSRRVIIWLIDNQPNIPSGSMRKMTGIPAGELHTEKAAFTELFESDTMVTGLIERSTLSVLVDIFGKKNPAFWPLYKHNPPGDVYKYAKQTGGEVLGSSKEEVSGKLAELIDHIRTRYTFGYRPSRAQTPGTFCKIKLKMAPSIEKREGKVAIRTRSGTSCTRSSPTSPRRCRRSDASGPLSPCGRGLE